MVQAAVMIRKNWKHVAGSLEHQVAAVPAAERAQLGYLFCAVRKAYYMPVADDDGLVVRYHKVESRPISTGYDSSVRSSSAPPAPPSTSPALPPPPGYKWGTWAQLVEHMGSEESANDFRSWVETFEDPSRYKTVVVDEHGNDVTLWLLWRSNINKLEEEQ